MNVRQRSILLLLSCLLALAFIPASALPARAAGTSLTSHNSTTSTNTPLPYPSWWNGSPCDTSAIPNSAPLGATYRGMPACGPRGVPASDNKVVTFPGGWGQLEWQCVELSMRYLYLAYGIDAYPANGKDVVWNYTGALLQKIHNDGAPHIIPSPGDVLSYDSTPTNPYGHTSIVTNTHIDATGNGYLDILEQNGSPTGADRLNVTNWVVTPGWTTISGWLHYVGPTLTHPHVGSAKDQPVYTFNANNQMRWHYKNGSFVPSAALVVRGIVYASSADTYIYALKASDDTLLWRYQTGGPIRAAPTAANGVIYIGSTDACLYALDASTGKLFWRYHAGAAIASSAVVNKSHIYFSALDNYVYALDTTFGSLLWRFHLKGNTVTAPVIGNTILYAGASNRILNGLNGLNATYILYALNASDGALLWTFQTNALIQAPPTLDNGKLYIGSGNFSSSHTNSGNTSSGNISALNAATGKLLWSFHTGGAVVTTPVNSKGFLYVASIDGVISALNTNNGKLLWRYQTPISAHANLTSLTTLTITLVAHGIVYATTGDAYIYALNTKNGSLLSSYHAGSALQSLPEA